jgi:long-chain acyl-CoA synthetase
MPADPYGTPVSVEVGPDAAPGESRARRLRLTADKLTTTPREGLATTWDIINYAANTFKDQPGFGWRDVVDIVEEEKEVTKIVDGKEIKETKKWQFYQLSDYKYLSFREFRDAAAEVAKGLLEVGIEKGEVFNIYARTRCVNASEG